MSRILFSVVLILLSNIGWSDAACKVPETKAEDLKDLVDVRVFKVTDSEYAADINGQYNFNELSLREIMVYRGNQDAYSFAFKLSFRVTSSNFSAWLVGHKAEVDGLSVYFTFSGVGTCGIEVVKPLRITSTRS